MLGLPKKSDTALLQGWKPKIKKDDEIRKSTIFFVNQKWDFE